jgi:hypothetical protein
MQELAAHGPLDATFNVYKVQLLSVTTATRQSPCRGATSPRNRHLEAPLNALRPPRSRSSQDFHNYTGGVYAHKSGLYDGLHSVKIVGYGTEAGTDAGTGAGGSGSGSGLDYWLVQNSWGASWGIEGGFFKIQRGVDMCGFESEVYGGAPLL